MAPLVRTGGSRHTGLAAPPHRNNHTRWLRSELKPEHEKKIIEAINCLMGEEVLKYKEPNSIVEPTKEVNAEPPADFSDLFKDLLEDFN